MKMIEILNSGLSVQNSKCATSMLIASLIAPPEKKWIPPRRMGEANLEVNLPVLCSVLIQNALSESGYGSFLYLFQER